jgi:hypothetical protein
MLIDYLKNIPLFKGIKESQLNEVAARCKSAPYKKWAIIFHEADLSTDHSIVKFKEVEGRPDLR